jgi:hypothetical protein
MVAKLKTGKRGRKTRLGQVHEAGRRIRRGRRSKRRTYTQCDTCRTRHCTFSRCVPRPLKHVGNLKLLFCYDDVLILIDKLNH